MKTINNTPFVDFKGAELKAQDGNGELGPVRPADLILTTLNAYRADMAKAGQIFKLGTKIAMVEPDAVSFEVEDAEHRLIKDACQDNPAGYYALLLGQLSERLENGG